MTSLETFFALPVVHRLGWMLLHSLWQLALVAALLSAVLLLLRRRSSNSRYLAGCIAMVLMVALPAATVLIVQAGPADRAVWPPASFASAADLPSPYVLPHGLDATTPAADATAGAGAASPRPQPWQARLTAWLEAHLQWVVAAWLAGVVALSLRIVAGWVAAQRLRRRCCIAVSAAWQARFADLARRIGVSRPVRLLESSLAEVPTVIGHLRPVILLPISALTGLAPQQVEAILAHELAHIRRHDYLVNLVQVMIETLLFYHPAAWWVSRRIRIERENCCDDRAVDLCGDRFAYIRALVSLEETRTEPLPRARLAVAWQGASLLDRARRLLGAPAPQATPSGRWMAGPVVLVAALAIAVGLLISASTVRAADGADSGNPFRRPHWQTYRVSQPDNGSSNDIRSLTVSVPKELEPDKQPEDKNAQTVLVTTWVIQMPPERKDASVSSLLGEDDKAAATRPADKARFDKADQMVLSRRQVDSLLQTVQKRKDVAVLGRPQVLLLDHQAATVQIGEMDPLALPRQGGTEKMKLRKPSGVLLAFSADIVPGEKVKLHLFGRWERLYYPVRQSDDVVGLNEAAVQRRAELPSGSALLVRMPTGSSLIRSYRERATGPGKPSEIDLFLEPDPEAEPTGPILLLLQASIRPPETKNAQSGQQSDAASPAIPAEFPADAAVRLAHFPINDAKPADVIAAFGKPKSYRNGGQVLDEKALPDFYCMDYGNGFMVWVSQGQVEELRLEGQTPPEMKEFAYQGRLKLGSSLEDVLAVMGPPDRVQEGGPMGYEDGVLYKNVQREGRPNITYYDRKDRGLRVALFGNEVKALYLTRTQPPAAEAAFSRDALPRIDQVRIGKSTRDDVVQAFGKPTSYWWHQGNLDENNLPRVYLMQYPGGLTFMMNNHYVSEVRIEGGQTQHPSTYAYRGVLRVGSSMQDAINVLGQPTRVQEGGPLGFEDGVLYKNAEWQGTKGVGYYSRADQGVRMFFDGDKALSLYLTRVEPADDPTLAAGIGEKLSALDINTATADDILRSLGRPARYVANNQDVDEASLPQRYMMTYPNGVQVAVDDGQVMAYHFTKPTSYAYQGILRVGSTMDEVKQALGEPKRVTPRPDPSTPTEDGVLYTDSENMGGYSLYTRNDLGVRVVLHQDRVAMMMIARPQAGQGTVP